jgi:hypothetical protein
MPGRVPSWLWSCGKMSDSRWNNDGGTMLQEWSMIKGLGILQLMISFSFFFLLLFSLMIISGLVWKWCKSYSSQSGIHDVSRTNYKAASFNVFNYTYLALLLEESHDRLFVLFFNLSFQFSAFHNQLQHSVKFTPLSSPLYYSKVVNPV